MSETGQKPEVFISYAHEDMHRRKRIERYLKSKGIICHFDIADFQKGDNFDKLFAEKAQKCDYLLLLISQYAIQSEQVKKEYWAAYGWCNPQKFQLKAILGIRLDNCVYIDAHAFPYMVNEIYADLREEKKKSHTSELGLLANKILDAVKSLPAKTIKKAIKHLPENIEASDSEKAVEKQGFKIWTKCTYIRPPLIGQHPGIAQISLTFDDGNEMSFVLDVARPQDSSWLRAYLPAWSVMFEANEWIDQVNPHKEKREEFYNKINTGRWKQAGWLFDIVDDHKYPPSSESILIAGTFPRELALDTEGLQISEDQFKARIGALMDLKHKGGKLPLCDAMYSAAGPDFEKFSNKEIAPIAKDEKDYKEIIRTLIKYTHLMYQAYIWFYFNKEPNPYRLYLFNPQYLAVFYTLYLERINESLKDWLYNQPTNEN